MSGNDYIVPPLSWAHIGKIAAEYLDLLDLREEPFIPIIDIMEKVMSDRLKWFSFEVDEVEDMHNAYGFTYPDGSRIVLRRDAYDAACGGDGRHRFTAAHELGHWAMHTNIPLARLQIGQTEKIFRLSEPQANQFAAELLMPPWHFQSSDSAAIVATRHGVSEEAAGYRLEYLRKKGVI